MNKDIKCLLIILYTLPEIEHTVYRLDKEYELEFQLEGLIECLIKINKAYNEVFYE